MRFKIKIDATSYLPLMGTSLTFLANLTAAAYTAKHSISPGAMWKEDKNSTLNNPAMVGGRTYPFVLSSTNPVYDPIRIRLIVLRSPLPLRLRLFQQTSPVRLLNRSSDVRHPRSHYYQRSRSALPRSPRLGNMTTRTKTIWLRISTRIWLRTANTHPPRAGLHLAEVGR